MKQFNDLISRNDLLVNKYTLKGKTAILDTDKGHFVLKENKGNDIYKYLLSRNFRYFPKIIDSTNKYVMYEYIDDISYDNDQRALDLIRLLSLLHSKTTYYKEIDYDEHKKIYENLKEKINYISNYYTDIINIIESKLYPSPSEYLIERNITKIFSCIYYCNNELDKWYELIKEKNKKRVVTLHNNIDLSHLLKNNNIYLISWDKNKIDLPIYDIVEFYNKYALDFDFSILLDEYEKIFPLLEEEKILLNILISIPEKISVDSNEYNKVRKVRKMLDKIYKTEKLLTSKKEETTST